MRTDFSVFFLKLSTTTIRNSTHLYFCIHISKVNFVKNRMGFDFCVQAKGTCWYFSGAGSCLRSGASITVPSAGQRVVKSGNSV